jgi:hypothetical protein
MSDRYCPECGAELASDPSYCSDCGAAFEDDHDPDTTDVKTTTNGDSWEWLDPYGPFRSPRRALGTLNAVGFISFLMAIGLNAVGLPITALPHPIDISLFAFWFGVIVVGLPLWGLLHATDNVLGFLKHE